MHLWSLLPLLAPILISPDECRERRDRLRTALPGSAILLFGAQDHDFAELRSGFVQEPNFYYLTGWNEPGAALLMLPEGREPREILFLPDRDERKERYDGPRAAAQDSGLDRLTGFAAVLSIDKLDQELSRHRDDIPRWLTLKAHAARLATMLGVEAGDAGPEIARLRVRKSAKETGLIERSIEVSTEGHLAAWRRVRAGLNEYQLAATATGVFLERGCERSAYPPIVGSGPRSLILHYNGNGHRLAAGELILMDMGAECGYYAADLTRTLPVNGKFTPRQRELYQAVLGAQRAAIAAVKPGASMQSLTRVAQEYLNQHGKDLAGEPLGKYFTHAIGHHVGLEVHDPGPLTELAPGMVITIEPGVYIPSEGIGIRIEDMVLVTAHGARVLSSGLPKEAAEIEKILAR